MMRSPRDVTDELLRDAYIHGGVDSEFKNTRIAKVVASSGLPREDPHKAAEILQDPYAAYELARKGYRAPEHAALCERLEQSGIDTSQLDEMDADGSLVERDEQGNVVNPYAQDLD